MNNIYIRRCLVIVNIILLLVIISDFELYYSNLREGDFGISAAVASISLAFTAAKIAYLGAVTNSLVLSLIFPATWIQLAVDIALEVIPRVIEASVSEAKKVKSRTIQLNGIKDVPYVVVEKEKNGWINIQDMNRQLLIGTILDHSEDGDHTRKTLKKEKKKKLRLMLDDILTKKDGRPPHGLRYIKVRSFKCAEKGNVPRSECIKFQCDLQKNEKGQLQVPPNLTVDWARVPGTNKMETTRKAKTKKLKYKYSRLVQCYAATCDAKKDSLSKKYRGSKKSKPSTNTAPNVKQDSTNVENIPATDGGIKTSLDKSDAVNKSRRMVNNINSEIKSIKKSREKRSKSLNKL